MFVSLFLILFPISSFAIQVDIHDISDDKYFQAAHEALSKAKDSIYVAMYEISIEPDKRVIDEAQYFKIFERNQPQF